MKLVIKAIVLFAFIFNMAGQAFAGIELEENPQETGIEILGSIPADNTTEDGKYIGFNDNGNELCFGPISNDAGCSVHHLEHLGQDTHDGIHKVGHDGLYVPDAGNNELFKYSHGDFVVFDVDDGKYHKPSKLKIRDSELYQSIKNPKGDVGYGENSLNNFINYARTDIEDDGFTNHQSGAWAYAFTAYDNDFQDLKDFRANANDHTRHIWDQLNVAQKFEYLEYNHNNTLGKVHLPRAPIGNLH